MGPGLSADDRIDQVVAGACAVGFQATNFGRAVDEVDRMLEGRELPVPEDDDDAAPDTVRRCTIYLGMVANLFGTGVRDSARFLASEGLVDVVVVSGGGLEHDLRSLFPWHGYRVAAYGSEQKSNAAPMHEGNWVSMGNVTYRSGPCPTDDGALCCWDHTMRRVLLDMLRRPRGNTVHDDDDGKRQPSYGADDTRVCYRPSTFWAEAAARFAELLPVETAAQSFAVPCQRRGIAVYSPSFSDGDVADIVRAVHRGGGGKRLVIDLVGDISELNRTALRAKRTGMIIVGGGVVKHHVCNANLMRNGADHSVFLNSGQEFDGSDAGARPDEAVSWGKIRLTARPAKVYSEASLVFPMLVARTFFPWASAHPTR
jgi:deoxyhypusine synthase